MDGWMDGRVPHTRTVQHMIPARGGPTHPVNRAIGGLTEVCIVSQFPERVDADRAMEPRRAHSPTDSDQLGLGWPGTLHTRLAKTSQPPVSRKLPGIRLSNVSRTALSQILIGFLMSERHQPLRWSLKYKQGSLKTHWTAFPMCADTLHWTGGLWIQVSHKVITVSRYHDELTPAMCTLCAKHFWSNGEFWGGGGFLSFLSADRDSQFRSRGSQD